MFVGNDYEWLKTANRYGGRHMWYGIVYYYEKKVSCSRPENFVSIASWFIWTCVLFFTGNA